MARTFFPNQHSFLSFSLTSTFLHVICSWFSLVHSLFVHLSTFPHFFRGSFIHLLIYLAIFSFIDSLNNSLFSSIDIRVVVQALSQRESQRSIWYRNYLVPSFAEWLDQPQRNHHENLQKRILQGFMIHRNIRFVWIVMLLDKSCWEDQIQSFSFSFA